MYMVGSERLTMKGDMKTHFHFRPEPFPARGSFSEASRISVLLRKETVGGFLLVVAAIIAMTWANSPWSDMYFTIRNFEIGYAPWHLRLSVGQWTSDGLLAIFFFMVGLELKREFVIGDLRKFSTAVVPIAAAFGGVAVPALIYTAVVSGRPDLHHGWAIPTATDIAFAVAILAIIGSKLPSALRIFLLTLAVVDDLIAITIIAVFYSESINLGFLLASLGVIAVYGLIAQRYRGIFGLQPFAAWIVLFPIGVVAWAFMHASGVHATIAGVLLGLTIPVLHRDSAPKAFRQRPGLAEEFERRFRPLSTGVAVPMFALFAAGVPLGGVNGFCESLTSTVSIAVMLALVFGKPIGIVVATWVMTRLTRKGLDPSYHWIDMVGVGMLAGIGFTVSLLVAELSFVPGSIESDHAKVAILAASLIAAALSSLVLVPRNRHYRIIHEAEQIDADQDGIPDVYQGDQD